MAAGLEPIRQAAGRYPPLWAAVAAVALVVAMPVATWWLVGDQTDPDFKRRLQAVGDPAIRAGLDPDYMFRPFDPAGLARALGRAPCKRIKPDISEWFRPRFGT